MAKNNSLNKAKTAKNDEFYTRLTDIEKEEKYFNISVDRIRQAEMDNNI